MAKKLVSIFILLIISVLGFSQSPKQDSIAQQQLLPITAKTIDSTFVTYNAYQLDSLYLNSNK